MKFSKIIIKILVCILSIAFILPINSSNINAQDYGLGWRTITQKGKIYTYDSEKTYKADYTVKVTIYNDPSGRYTSYKLVSCSLSKTELGNTRLEDFRVVEVNSTRTLVTFMITASFGGIVGSDYKGSATFSASVAGPYMLKGDEIHDL